MGSCTKFEKCGSQGDTFQSLGPVAYVMNHWDKISHQSPLYGSTAEGQKARKAARHTETKLGKTAQRNGGGSGWERVGKLAHACCKARGGGDARQASQVRGGRRIVKPRRCNTDSHTAACPNESHAGGKVVPLRMQLFPNNPAFQLMQELPPEMHFNSPYIPRAETTTLFHGQGTRVSPEGDTGWNLPRRRNFITGLFLLRPTSRHGRSFSNHLAINASSRWLGRRQHHLPLSKRFHVSEAFQLFQWGFMTAVSCREASSHVSSPR